MEFKVQEVFIKEIRSNISKTLPVCAWPLPPPLSPVNLFQESPERTYHEEVCSSTLAVRTNCGAPCGSRRQGEGGRSGSPPASGPGSAFLTAPNWAAGLPSRPWRDTYQPNSWRSSITQHYWRGTPMTNCTNMIEEIWSIVVIPQNITGWKRMAENYEDNS